jgi:hypothetical protein
MLQRFDWCDWGRTVSWGSELRVQDPIGDTLKVFYAN